MKIGIDVDGVLANFNEAYIDLTIAETGEDRFPPRPFDILSWNYPEEDYGYTKLQMAGVWAKIKTNPKFWESLNPLPGTHEALNLLGSRSRSGDDVYYITSRPGINAKRQTETWLRKHGLADRPTVLLCTHKHYAAAALELDAYLDDRWAPNVVSVNEYVPYCLTAILDQPWNRKYSIEGTNIIRVTSVQAFLCAISRTAVLVP